MSKDLNKVMFTGRLGRDVDLKYTPNGQAVATFSVASERAVRDDSDPSGWRQETEWFRVVAWNDLAERIAKNVNKGDRVYAEGRLQTREWTDQQGIKRYSTEMICSDYILLDSRAKKTAKNANNGYVEGDEAFYPSSEDEYGEEGEDANDFTDSEEEASDTLGDYNPPINTYNNSQQRDKQQQPSRSQPKTTNTNYQTSNIKNNQYSSAPTTQSQRKGEQSRQAVSPSPAQTQTSKRSPQPIGDFIRNNAPASLGKNQ